MVLFIIASNRLYLICPSDSAGRAPHGPPTLVQLEALRHLASSVAIYWGNSPENFELIDWARELSKNRMAYDGEEVGTAETLTMEQVLPALHPEGVAASLYAPDVAGGQVLRALLDPESQLLPQTRWPTRAPRTKMWASKEVCGNLVAHFWKIGLIEPIANRGCLRR